MTPPFFTDECFSGPIVQAMRNAGFDVVRAVDVCPSASDETVAAIAFAQGRVLVTEDYDFGKLCVQMGLPAHGVVIVSLKPLPLSQQGAQVTSCLANLSGQLIGSFVVIEPARVRVRPLP
jgi:predicted nuclease of predicted toxin-antitoxin system